MVGGDRQKPLSASKNRTNWNFSGEGANAFRAYLEFRKAGSEQAWKPHVVALAEAYYRAPFRFSLHLVLSAKANPLSKRPKLRDEEVVIFRALPGLINERTAPEKVRSISHAIAELSYQAMLDAVRLSYSDAALYGDPEEKRRELASLFEKHGLPVQPLLQITSEEVMDAAA